MEVTDLGKAIQIIANAGYDTSELIDVVVIEKNESDRTCTCVSSEHYIQGKTLAEYETDNLNPDISSVIYYNVVYGALVPKDFTRALISISNTSYYAVLLAWESSGETLSSTVSAEQLNKISNAKLIGFRNNYASFGKGVWHISDYGVFGINFPFYSFTTYKQAGELEILKNMINVNVNEQGGIFIGQSITTEVKEYEIGNRKVEQIVETYEEAETEVDKLSNIETAMNFLLAQLFKVTNEQLTINIDKFQKNNPKSAQYVNDGFIQNTGNVKNWYYSQPNTYKKATIRIAAILRNLTQGGAKLQLFKKDNLNNNDYEAFTKLDGLIKTNKSNYKPNSSEQLGEDLIQDIGQIVKFIEGVGSRSYRYNINILDDLFSDLTVFLSKETGTYKRLQDSIKKFVNTGVRETTKFKDVYNEVTIDLPSLTVIKKETKHSLNATLNNTISIIVDQQKVLYDFFDSVANAPAATDITSAVTLLSKIQLAASLAKSKLPSDNDIKKIRTEIDEYLLKEPIKYDKDDTQNTR